MSSLPQSTVVEPMPLPTAFLPAERASEEKLAAQVLFFGKRANLELFLDAVPDVYLVLNEERQIVFANERMLELISAEDWEKVRGLRPGEALNCLHANENEGGCGTTEFCRTCGAAQAILSSLNGKAAVKECRIIQESGNALDLRVWTTPADVDGTRFTIFSVQDIASEKRRRVLERIFFHDILNTAGVLRGVSELLEGATVDEMEELHEMVADLSVRLIDEIQAQKDLMAAENGELTTRRDVIDAVAFVNEQAAQYRSHYVAEGKTIAIAPDLPPVMFESDRRLLGRVLGNMIKNALEAVSVGETVSVGYALSDVAIEFWVHNPTFMPRNVQLQVFQRSFSTKGTGRGLGTYSIKLLTERYLKGKVRFTTDRTAGTTFFASYPID